MTEDYWVRFWRNKSDPDHSSNDPAYYDLMAAELLVLLGQGRFDTVFELGCGNGAFYQRLGFDKTRYTGIDFSETMLSAFRKAYPETRLEVADARVYVPREPVDLIFSNGVLQNLSLTDIDRHLASAVSALKPGGQIVHAAVPWNLLRWAYYSGAIHGRKRSRLRHLISYLVARCGLRRSLGYWYSLDAIRKIASKHGLETTFYGSLLYPYRFHVRMIPRAR